MHLLRWWERITKWQRARGRGDSGRGMRMVRGLGNSQLYANGHEARTPASSARRASRTSWRRCDMACGSAVSRNGRVGSGGTTTPAKIGATT